MVKPTILSIPFQLGYRGDVDPRSLPDGATADCANLLFDRQSLRIRPGFTAATAAPANTRQLAEYANPANTLTPKSRLLAVSGTQIQMTGSDGTFATGQTLNTTVDGTNPVRMAQYGTALYMVDGTNPVKKALSSEYVPTLATPLVETSAPAGAPTVVQSGAGTLSGVCAFSYSFAHPIPGATLISESALSPAGQSSNLPANSGVTVTTATTTPGDYVYLYQQDSGGQWRQVGQQQVSTRLPHLVFAVSAPPASGAAPYAPAATAPPPACSLLLAHANRMWYARGDTLYISNLDNPELAPQALTINADPTSGGFIRIGEDGGAITALAEFGSYLIVFKERGIWRVDGAPGDATFAVMLISSVHGALMHEGACAADDRVLCWLEAGGVWAWDGSRMFEIGRPIRDDWAALDPACQRQSSLVYDPEQRMLMLLLGAGVVSTPLAGRALLCSITVPVERATDGTPLYLWAPATGLPHAVARYLPHQATPGVYAVDATANLPTSVYRMNAGTTDAGQPIAWHWADRRRMSPNPTAYKSVQRLWLVAGDAAAMPAVTVQLDIGDETSQTTLTGFTDAGATWTPPAHADCSSYQVTLSGASSTGGELIALLADISLRGRIQR